MKDLLKDIRAIEEKIHHHQIRSVSFDIDGTVYPLLPVKLRWWKHFFLGPSQALRFLSIRKRWEGRRAGKSAVAVDPEDIEFFEGFLVGLLGPSLVPREILEWIRSLRSRGVRVIFLSDHGAEAKLKALELSSEGEALNCLLETGELKPHRKIAELMAQKFAIVPEAHLHLGDRWTDEEQARLMGVHFCHFSP